VGESLLAGVTCILTIEFRVARSKKINKFDSLRNKMWKKVFPEFAVKQAMQEFGLHRGDEVLVSRIQTELLPRCLLDIVKSSSLVAILAKRKFINLSDMEYAKRMSIFMFKDCPSDAGALLEHRYLCNMTSETSALLQKYMVRCFPALTEFPRFSDSMMHKLQDILEGFLRGFFVNMQQQHYKSTQINSRHFDSTISTVLGDWSLLTSQENYAPI
jgi:histone H3/H4